MPKKKFSDELRKLVRESGISHYRIRMDTGLDRAVISRFVNGKAFLSVEALDTLADYLGWKTVADKRKKTNG
jgi:hypothetical protein